MYEEKFEIKKPLRPHDLEPEGGFSGERLYSPGNGTFVKYEIPGSLKNHTISEKTVKLLYETGI